MSTVMPTAWAPIVRAIPVPPTSTRVEQYMRVVGDGWREIGEIAKGTGKRKLEDVNEKVYLNIVGIFREHHSAISQEESDQILLFLAKLPTLPDTTYCFSRWSDFYQILYSSGYPSPQFSLVDSYFPNVLDAVILNAITNDHSELLRSLPSFKERTQTLVLAYLIASKKNEQILDRIIHLISPPKGSLGLAGLIATEGSQAGFLKALGKILAMGREEKISMVNDYIRREPFDLDTVMIVWEALGLSERVTEEGVAKEAAIASLEARMVSLPDEEKGRVEAFRNKMREGRKKL